MVLVFFNKICKHKFALGLAIIPSVQEGLDKTLTLIQKAFVKEDSKKILEMSFVLINFVLRDNFYNI